MSEKELSELREENPSGAFMKIELSLEDDGRIILEYDDEARGCCLYGDTLPQALRKLADVLEDYPTSGNKGQ